MKGLVSLLAVLMSLLAQAAVQAHGGGLDAYGCHHDRKHGGCRRHRGPLAGRASAPKDEMLRVLKEQEGPGPAPGTPAPRAPVSPPKR